SRPAGIETLHVPVTQFSDVGVMMGLELLEGVSPPYEEIFDDGHHGFRHGRTVFELGFEAVEHERKQVPHFLFQLGWNLTRRRITIVADIAGLRVVDLSLDDLAVIRMDHDLAYLLEQRAHRSFEHVRRSLPGVGDHAAEDWT